MFCNDESRKYFHMLIVMYNMKYIGLSLFIIGLTLLGISYTMEPYINEQQYTEKYMSIDRESLGREASFEQFHSLRESYLTNKYKIEDYGYTFVILGLFISASVWKGWRSFRAPKNKWAVVLCGLTAALTTVAAYVGRLFLEFNRGSYPHWADSLGIPLMGVPVMALLLLGWVGINLLGIKNNYVNGANISRMGLKKLNVWYMVLAILIMAITLLCVIDGDFLLIGPGILWLYFYVAILAGRKAANQALHTDSLPLAGER